MPDQPGTPWQKIRKFVSDYGDIQTVIGIASGFIVAAKRVSLMPGGWHPPQYWLTALAWLFGTWALFAVIVRMGESLWGRFHPPQASLDVYGGENVSVVLTNSGTVPIKFLASGQLLDASDVPFQRRRPFQLDIWQGHEFKPHETTHGIIAQANELPYASTLWLKGDTGSIVDRWQLRELRPDKRWLHLSVNIRTQPPMSSPIERVIQFRFNGTVFEVNVSMPPPR